MLGLLLIMWTERAEHFEAAKRQCSCAKPV